MARKTSKADISVVVSDAAVEVVGELDRRRAETLAVELRAAARRRGVEVRSVRVVPDERDRSAE